MGHIATRPLEMGIVSAINLGVDRGLLTNGNLTSKDAAKTAVDAAGAKLHVAERLLATPVKAALDVVDAYQTGYTTGGNATNLGAVNAGQNIRGFYGVFS